MKKISHSIEEGFTIIELMIALSVMSVILIMSTVILIQIGGIYDKGVSGSNLQNSSRSIVQDISSAIEFSGYNPAVTECSPSPLPVAVNNSCYVNGASTDPYPPEYAYCIGTVRYSFIVNAELGTDAGVTPPATTNHVLWRDVLNHYNDPCVPVDFNNLNNPHDSYTVPGSGHELMAYHTRITAFNITPATGPELTGTGNVYDITFSTAYGDSDLLNISGANTTCKSQITLVSTQFCSTASVSSTINARVY